MSLSAALSRCKLKHSVNWIKERKINFSTIDMYAVKPTNKLTKLRPVNEADRQTPSGAGYRGAFVWVQGVDGWTCRKMICHVGIHRGGPETAFCTLEKLYTPPVYRILFVLGYVVRCTWVFHSCLSNLLSM